MKWVVRLKVRGINLVLAVSVFRNFRDNGFYPVRVEQYRQFHWNYDPGHVRSISPKGVVDRTHRLAAIDYLEVFRFRYSQRPVRKGDRGDAFCSHRKPVVVGEKHVGL